jgi:hypothetical protein
LVESHPTGPDGLITSTDALLADATPDVIREWAACWALWWSPASVSYRAEQAERAYAERIRAVSHDLSTATRWSAIGPSHTELVRRRRLTSVLPCGLCGEDTEVEHPLPPEHYAALPSTHWVRCANHAAVAA